MQFRFHRGGLAESMATVVELPDRDALAAHINNEYRTTFEDMGLGAIAADKLEVKPYGVDQRIGWDTYLVSVPGFGPVGMLNGPCG